MKITIESNSGTFDFACEADERMLYAGLVQGLTLPYECATGTCGTCRGRVRARLGARRMGGGAGLRQAQAREGRHPDVPGAAHRRLHAARARQDRPAAKPETLPAHRHGRIENVRQPRRTT